MPLQIYCLYFQLFSLLDFNVWWILMLGEAFIPRPSWKNAFWVHISEQQGTITWIPPLKETFLLFTSSEMN